MSLIDEALAQPTFCAAFQLTAAAYAEDVALTTPDGSFSLTWAQYAARVRSIAEGLASLGVQRGDCVGLLLSNRPEFHLVDNATVHLGATPFSIYHTNPPERIVPLLENSGARVMITETAFLDRVLAARALHPALAHVVVLDGDAGTLTLAEVEALGAPPGLAFDACWRSLGADDVVTLVYTSGTTGEPKGVQHTHATIMASCLSMHRYAPFSHRGRVVSYLPNAHIAERFISHYCSQVFGLTICGCADPKQLSAAIVKTRPTRFFGVPRIYERLMGAAVDMGAEAPARLGLDQAEWVGVAAAPSPRRVLEFFPSIGIELIEFWGMSECIFSVAPPRERVKIGRIGVAAPGVEIRLAADGEILVRGPNVMVGYRGEPEKTAEAIDDDGWLYSGDVAEADEDGYLKIVDRKKELIINSAGKNMAPSKIELAVKQGSPLIAHVVAIGDRRPYVSALIVLDEDACARHPDWDGDLAGFAQSAAVRDEVARAIEAGNATLARVEQVRRHSILDVAWPPGSDEVTPTLKVRRKPIAEKYAFEISALYDGQPVEA
jgi:long-subunit acyl-CoA synthetase (AMP-forming)